MEEERIGAMYANLWKRRLDRLQTSLFPRGFWRSPLLFAALITFLILGPGIAYFLHRKGQFHRVKHHIGTELEGETFSDAGKPGGVSPVVLARVQTAGSNTPEFLSATILPGLGMGVLQITAFLPGRGESPLLSAPTMDAIVQGTLGPISGVNDDHGSIEAPWGGELMGGLTPVGTTIAATWNGKTMDIPTNASEPAGVAEGGLLSMQTPDTVNPKSSPQGDSTVGYFKALTFDDHWTSKTDTQVTVQMNAHTIELTVRTKNTGDEPEPMGIGWHPRFEVTRGSRQHAQLRLPDGELMEIAEGGKPSGKTTRGGSVLERFGGKPTELGALPLDATLVNLKASPGDAGPAVEMLNPAAGYGLRLTGESSSIHALRVVSPSDAGYVSMGMQTNMDDPFGHEWENGDGTKSSGITTLEPGEMLEWKVKLEIFSVARQ